MSEILRTEASVTINDYPLTRAQSITLRVAINMFVADLQQENSLGEDEHGKEMRANYLKRLAEIQRMWTAT